VSLKGNKQGVEMDRGSYKRIRVVDLETTGKNPTDAIVEIAAVDLVGDEIIVIGSDLVKPFVPIPPEASAVHHITDSDVSGCPPLEDHLPHYLDYSGSAGVSAFAAHNWQFEAQWLGDAIGERPAICTYKCALRAWPEAPAHNNQTLRYWLKPKGLSGLIASTAHRALPDAYVTAFILRELLQVASFEELVDWTKRPALLPRVNFGKHRGCEWSDVPLDYLAWIIDKSDMSGDIKFTAAHHRRLRQAQSVFTAAPSATGALSSI
jgi:exodeoxyribonuclease X